MNFGTGVGRGVEVRKGGGVELGVTNTGETVGPAGEGGRQALSSIMTKTAAAKARPGPLMARRSGRTIFRVLFVSIGISRDLVRTFREGGHLARRRHSSQDPGSGYYFVYFLNYP